MTIDTKPVPDRTRIRITSYRFLFSLLALEGWIALVTLFRQPSEAASAVWLGFSLLRLLLGMAALLLSFGFSCLTVYCWIHRENAAGLDSLLDKWLIHKHMLPTVVGVLSVALSYLLLAGLLNLTSLKPLLGMYPVVFERTFLFYLWVVLFCIQSLIFLATGYPDWLHFDQWSMDDKRRFLSSSLITSLLIGIGAHLGVIYFRLVPFQYFILFFAASHLAILGCFQLDTRYSERSWYRVLRSYLLAAAIFCLVFLAYRLTSIWVGHPNTPAKSYFDRLAVSFLEGRLYLKDPDSTHDLTLSQGEWYVANPPLVAVLMVPLVKLVGPYNLNTVVFSIAFGALNAALVFLMLEKLAALGWTACRSRGNGWLTFLFAFGTVHWYLAVVGKMWFMSQMVTVTLLALAILAVLRGAPGWLAGMAIGLAMAARPNIAMAIPILIGLVAQQQLEKEGRITWQRLFRWSAACALPMVIVVLGLLWYNYARFGDPLDYGYLTENVAGFMAGDLKEYGTFHPHFILRNLRVMFAGVPKMGECGLPEPKLEGMSMLLATPALVYLVRSFRKKTWVIGMWIGIFTLLLPLVMYYNTGAWQFGYKYLLDFILPVMALLGLAAGSRVQGLLKGLILASVLINLWGVVWWFELWCP